MRKADYPQGKWQNVAFFLAALLVLAPDQLSKLWIRSNLALGQTLFDVGFFRIIHISNTGAAFGLFPGQSFALSIVTIVGVALLLIFVLFVHRWFPLLDSMLSKVALGLILGGALGNLIDRLYLGYVTDFIDFKVWPVFNIADSAEVIGVIIIFAYSLRFLARAGKG